MSGMEAFWAKVDRRAGDECWPWLGGVTGRGYGSWQDRRGFPVRTRGVHRVAYEEMVGPIPEGLTIDHLCRNKLCVNPAHLEPVTNEENVARAQYERSHCPEGHAYSEENKVGDGKGGYRCRACNNDRRRARRAAAGKTLREPRVPRVPVTATN